MPRLTVRRLLIVSCVVAALTASGAQAQTPGAARVDSPPASAWVAVLPFANISRQPADDWIRVGGVDGRFRLGGTHSVSFLAVASEHQDELTGHLSGPVVEIDFSRRARNLSYGISHSSVDPEFRTESGFVPRVDIRRTDANVAYQWWPQGTLIN